MKYVVKSGDSLSRIGEKFGVSVSQLQQWNGIKNPDFILVGQELMIMKESNDTLTRKITRSQLEAIGWSNFSEQIINDLNQCINVYRITELNPLQHFISQCSHESGCGKWRIELASGEAYEGRSDLGNVFSGDGRKFKGAGLIQLTGRYNYTQFSLSIADPEVVNQGVTYVAERYPWSSAGYWWEVNGMNDFCLLSPTVEQVTFKVNGGYNGLASRKFYYEKCCEVIS
ncbi:LysM peptidoglycan-binding domain-containing protein [Enterococcus sp. AZ162]|uniref:LysM peptidoglycan-binding domain-containing protein n=1 Tax=unclassified Enterococcus TaxID=2608891 RepID=UPI003F241B40